MQTAPPEWNGGEKYGSKSDVYYRHPPGTVTARTQRHRGGLVRGRREKSDSFTYTAAVESDNDVFILSAEDYTGASPVQAPGPHYLSFYEDALAANGLGYDVYDVDALGRKAATALGVLSHYDAVVWYTGDDVITSEPGWAGGNGSRLAMDEMLHARDYLNEGGRVLYSGKNAGLQYAAPRCSSTTRPRPTRSARHSRRPQILGAACSFDRRRATCRTTCSSTGSARTCSTAGRA